MTPDTITTDDLRTKLAQGDPVTVLDIRPKDAFAEWHIPGSTNLPVYDQLNAGDPSGLARIQDADAPVVTVCGAGHTAAKATEALRARGVDARTLDGGLNAWSLAWNTAELHEDADAATVLQVRRTGKGCLSYIVASAGQAAVIDPSLDPDVYLELAKGRGWTITHVLETHVHADHLSRARKLAKATGATHLIPEGAPVTFPHSTLRDGDTVQLGKTRIQTVATPGHTPESATFLIDDRWLFTGDTLFLEGVGRPDLEAGGDAPNRARALHRSLGRLLALPDELLVLPAHASVPLGFDGQPHAAPLGDLADRIDLLGLDEGTFVDEILDRVPEAPPNHERIVEHNRAGTFPGDDVIELEAGANRCAAG